MTDENNSDSTGSLEGQLNNVLAGEMPLADLSAAQTGPLHYTVLSVGDGGARGHRVNIQTLRCSCEDMQYNKNLSSESSGGRELCKHVAFALLNHPQLNASESALYKSMGLMEEAAGLRDNLDMQLDRFEEALVELRDVNAGASAEASAEVSGSGESQPDADAVANAEDKAAELQAAFDNVLDDMEVQAAGGAVWFKTGFETPDEWPFPGGEETFSVITSPDMVKYVHDGSPDWADTPHPLNDERPGEYWKNALDPDDVDEYIATVLE